MASFCFLRNVKSKTETISYFLSKTLLYHHFSLNTKFLALIYGFLLKTIEPSMEGIFLYASLALFLFMQQPNT